MRLILLISSFLISFLSFAQNEVLLTINGEDIVEDEFTRVYEKNRSLINIEQDASPEKYLELFIDYKLKVQEAYRLNLDKKETYIKELAIYRGQLAKNHLNDVKVTDELVKEAYNRTRKELKARHILIRVNPDALPKDTLVAYNKLIKARSRILAGEDFKKVARFFSEDPSVRTNGGDLGWFKAFKMVYSFESAAYNTKVGEVSMPFRTNFGYHIVQPTDDRSSKGSIKVAHIMVALQQKDSAVVPEEIIQKVSNLLDNGASFETLALNYSDDGNSSKKGGILNDFEQGQLSSGVFEENAFGLKTIGAISKPFKTKFGWHIIKLLEKNPIPSFDIMQASLSQKVTKDARSVVISNKLTEKLRARYNVPTNEPLITYFKNFFPDNYKKQNYSLDDNDDLDKIAFTVADSSFTYRAVGNYLIDRYNRNINTSRDYFVDEEINLFTDSVIKKYHLEHLEEQDPTFRIVFQEYKEGLLLFDLLETAIWKKAQQDSAGLQNFYKLNRDQYISPKIFKAIIFTTEREKIAIKYKGQLLKGISPEIASESVKSSYPVILSTRSISENELPESQVLTLGVSRVIKDENNYTVYKVSAIEEKRLKSLEEVKGVVMSDYQKQLEVNFVKDLRSKSAVSINKGVLQRLVKKYNE